MAQNLFDTNVLIQVVPNLLRPQKFLLDRFFPNVVTSDSEYVSIDIDVGKRRMAPFVSPLVEGKLVEQRRMQTDRFKPAYIKDKRAPDLLKPIRRMIGERIGGSASGAERMMANLVAEMTDQIDGIDRRLEWMAAQALTTGAVTVSGDGFETVSVDFGRDSTLAPTLTSTATWTAAHISAGTATPSQNIETWQQTMLKVSGAVADTLVFTTGAWNMFILDPVVKQNIWYPGNGGAGNTIQTGPQIQTGAIYKGRWGQYDLYVYNDWYVDDNNVQQPMLPDNTIIMSGAQLLGTRAFGQILDPTFNYASLPYAPKTWVAEDPAQRYLMMQSSPIVIPSRVNAVLCATVA